MTTARPDKTISLDGLKAHAYADIFPMLRKDSVGFQALVQDIKANKLKERVTIYKGEILDGRNRVEALKTLGAKEITEYDEFKEYAGDDPLGFVLSANLHRRHLTTSQRAAIAATLTNLELGDNQHSGEGVLIDKASKLLNVSRISVARAKAVLANDPSLLEKIENGELTLNGAQQQLNDQPKDEVSPEAHPQMVTNQIRLAPQRRGQGERRKRRRRKKSLSRSLPRPSLTT